MSGRDHNKAESFAWCSLIANYIIFLHHSLFSPLLPHGLIDVVSRISSLGLAAALNSVQYILICQKYSLKIIAQYWYCTGLNSIHTSGGVKPVQLDVLNTHHHITQIIIQMTFLHICAFILALSQLEDNLVRIALSPACLFVSCRRWVCMSL